MARVCPQQDFRREADSCARLRPHRTLSELLPDAESAVSNRVRRRTETHRDAARFRTDGGPGTPERHDLQKPHQASVQPGTAEQSQGARAVAVFAAAKAWGAAKPSCAE